MRCVYVVAALLAVTVGACKGEQAAGKPASGGKRGPMQFPVEVRPVEARRVEYNVPAVGSVEAFETVQVTARVAGAAELVNFAEGDQVKKGQVILEIDPDRYRLNKESAKAVLERAEALLADATANVKRRQEANEKSPGMFTDEEIQILSTRVRTAEADVATARSNLALAELNLRDALVRAPISGIIQTRSVQTGQYVQPGAVLATLLRREPLLLRFEVPESEAARLSPNLEATFQVRGNAHKYTATVTHVADAANPQTRMVPITAKVNDPERAVLRPGSFAQVNVPVGSSEDAPVIPQTAVRPSERGFLAYIIEDDVARERVLTLGLRTSDGKVEVRRGLTPGETLVIRGNEALKDGVKVRVVKPAAPSEGPPETPVLAPAGSAKDAGSAAAPVDGARL